MGSMEKDFDCEKHTYRCRFLGRAGSRWRGLSLRRMRLGSEGVSYRRKSSIGERGVPS